MDVLHVRVNKVNTQKSKLWRHFHYAIPFWANKNDVRFNCLEMNHYDEN